MFRRTIYAALITVGLCFPAMAATFTSYYALGDSFTDDGKAGVLPAPSLGGRFTNGPVYAEYIAQLFTQNALPSFNLALGGATAGDINDNDAITPPALSTAFGTFGRQINTLVSSGAALLSGSKPLVSAFFGANDFFQNIISPGFDPVALAVGVIDRIKTISAIANFDNFLVMNLPDLSLIPSNAGLSPAQKSGYSNAVQLFNATLESELNANALVDPTFRYSVFDTFSAFNGLLADAEALGLRLDTICTPSILNPDDPNICPTPESAESFFFVDGTHPNSVVHRELARAVIADTDHLPSPVPLPSGLPLILSGLCGLAILRQRAAYEKGAPRKARHSSFPRQAYCGALVVRR